MISDGKSKYGSRVTSKDYYHNEENLAYLIDYKVQSSKVGGTHCTGSVYIRGVKGEDGVDNFKFILEKSNDFSDLDAEIVVNAYEQALKPKPGDMPEKPNYEGMTPA